MSADISYSQARHPGRHAERVSLAAIFYGLFAAPIMWAGNFMIAYGLISYACYPGRTPLASPLARLGFVWWLILGFHVLTLLVCFSGFAVSHRNWRLTGRESEGHVHHLMEVGEGRTRYLAVIGMSFSLLSFVAAATFLLAYPFENLCAFE